MDIEVKKELVILEDLHSLLCLYFRIKYILKDKKDITDCELDIISYLYTLGGYEGKEACDAFLEECVNRKYKRSIQSVRNSLSKLTRMGILEKSQNNSRNVCDTNLPDKEVFGIQYLITNLDVNTSSGHK